MAPRSLSQSDSSGSKSRMRIASMCKATSRSSAGVGKKILRDRVLRVCVEITAHRRRDVRQLVRRQTGTAAKHHVFGRVGHAGKIRGAFVRAHPVIDHGGDHRRERVADDDDLQAVRQRGPQHIRAVGSFIGRRAIDKQSSQHEAKNRDAQNRLGRLFFSRHKFDVQTTIVMRCSRASEKLKVDPTTDEHGGMIGRAVLCRCWRCEERRRARGDAPCRGNKSVFIRVIRG